MSETYDIAVVGAGFAGSLLAMIAHKLGRKVLLLERGSHPRIVIGESSTPLSNLLLEELSTRYDLPAIRPLCKWGAWQRSYPEIGCGLKRGFTFHHHVLGRPTAPNLERRDQLLVAASPHKEIADTHWYRADFDDFLVREAQRLGVEYLDQVKLDRISDHGDTVTLEGERGGQLVTYRARFVIDATGPRGFLHRALSLREVELPGYPKTQALYTHFSGAGSLAHGQYSRLLNRSNETPPHPIDDAAVHHVFDGGWVWVLRFNNGVTSAGVTATSELAARLSLQDGAPAWERLLGLIPALREQFSPAKPVMPFTYVSHLSFRSGEVVGDKWAMLPSAAGFVDPLLSTGFPLTLLGVSRLADMLENHWEAKTRKSALEDYAAKTDGELLATARLIGALYANMPDFEVFTSLSLLYFAAASYSETARRLGKPQMAASFLLYDEPTFGTACLELFERALKSRTKDESRRLSEDIQHAIGPWNVAGLGDPSRRNWYTVDSQDLISSAWKLGATRAEAADLLLKCGFELRHPTYY